MKTCPYALKALDDLLKPGPFAYSGHVVMIGNNVVKVVKIRENNQKKEV